MPRPYNTGRDRAFVRAGHAGGEPAPAALSNKNMIVNNGDSAT